MHKTVKYCHRVAWSDLQCGAQFTTGGADPYGTECDLPRGHYPKSDHSGEDPFGGLGRVTWRGGSSIAGDSVKVTDVHWQYPKSGVRRG